MGPPHMRKADGPKMQDQSSFYSDPRPKSNSKEYVKFFKKYYEEDAAFDQDVDSKMNKNDMTNNIHIIFSPMFF